MKMRNHIVKSSLNIGVWLGKDQDACMFKYHGAREKIGLFSLLSSRDMG